MPDNAEIRFEEQEGVEHIPSKCKILYIEICMFKETRDIFLFNERNYKVSISVRFVANRVDAVNTVFDTGAGPSFIQEASISAEWHRAIRAINRPALKNANIQKDSVVGTVTIHVRTASSRVEVFFVAVCHLPVQVLL